MAPDQALSTLHFRSLLISYLLSPQYPPSRVPSLLCSTLCSVGAGYRQNLFNRTSSHRVTVWWMGMPLVFSKKNHSRRYVNTASWSKDHMPIQVEDPASFVKKTVPLKNSSVSFSLVCCHSQGPRGHTQHHHWLGFMSSFHLHWPGLTDTLTAAIRWFSTINKSAISISYFRFPNFPFLLVTPMKNAGTALETEDLNTWRMWVVHINSFKHDYTLLKMKSNHTLKSSQCREDLTPLESNQHSEEGNDCSKLDNGM